MVALIRQKEREIRELKFKLIGKPILEIDQLLNHSETARLTCFLHHLTDEEREKLRKNAKNRWEKGIGFDRERVRYLNLGGLSENHKTKIGEARKEYLILHPEERERFRLANLGKT